MRLKPGRLRSRAGVIRSIAALSLLLPFVTALLLGYADGPKPQRTGGFGENTCIECHKTFELNAGRLMGGKFELDGVPAHYEAGQTYRLTVRISQPGQTRWGFELSSRSQQTGEQAGSLEPVDDFTQVKVADTVQYIEHTEDGTREGSTDGPVEFHVDWTAPDVTAGGVIFNAAGNAADDSWDPKGDYIYTAGGFSRPAGSMQPELSKAPERQPQRSRRLDTDSRLVQMHVPLDLNRHESEIHIEHRFLRSLSDASFGDAFGIDQGANIQLEYDFALTDRLSAGIARARFDQIVTMSGTFEVETDEASPWHMSVVGGVQGEGNFHRQYSPFIELPISVDLDRLRLFSAPLLVFNSRNEQDLTLFPEPVNPDSNNTFSLGAGVDVALNRRLSLALEAVPRLAGFGGFGPRYPSVAGAFKIRTWGHVFTIIVSSNRTFTPAQYAVNTEPGLSLGFNIYRRMR